MKKTLQMSMLLGSTLLSTVLLVACGHDASQSKTDLVLQPPTQKPDKHPDKTPDKINSQTGMVSEALTVDESAAVLPQSIPIESHARIEKHTLREQKIRQDLARKKHLLAGKQEAMSKQRLMQYAPSPVYSTTKPLQHGYRNIQDNEKYAHYESNSVIQTRVEPVSTFSIDVDTGSYSNIRRLLNSGNLPLKDAVRSEEMINYFNYQVADSGRQAPFAVSTEIGPSPWSEGRNLLKVGIKAVDVAQQELPPANLVFLVDVSGSMRSPDKLGLLKKSLSLLASRIRPQDTIAMVVYAGASGMVLEPTSGKNSHQIIRALDRLTAGGSTNGASGIRLAYQVAQQAFRKNGINRILLATDGDFNVGTTDFEQLKNLLEEKRKSGISLSTIGFGTGNYNDRLMEQLADAANGKYSYIDNLNEAQKVLVDEMSSSLKTVAKDGKIQIEFNPNTVAEYRLMGYENRKLNKEDFNNDKVDAGDIGAGDSVTVLYEIVLTDSKTKQIDDLRYPSNKNVSEKHASNASELAFVKIRYKKPGQEHSRLLTRPVYKKQINKSISKTSDDFRFAASVAGFAELLKGGEHQQMFSYQQIIELANNSKGDDPFGYRHEFIRLVRLAQSLSSSPVAQQNE